MAGCFDVSYEYDEDEDKTLCRLATTWGGVAIGASTRRPGIYLELTRDGRCVYVDLARSDVQQINSEMQRALSGCFEGEFLTSVTLVRPDPELERLLAEEEAIERAHKARKIEAAERAEREAELREEDEMNKRDALEDACRAQGISALWTAADLVAYLEENVHPDAHVAVKPGVPGVYHIVAVD